MPIVSPRASCGALVGHTNAARRQAAPRQWRCQLACFSSARPFSAVPLILSPRTLATARQECHLSSLSVSLLGAILLFLGNGMLQHELQLRLPPVLRLSGGHSTSVHLGDQKNPQRNRLQSAANSFPVPVVRGGRGVTGKQYPATTCALL